MKCTIFSRSLHRVNNDNWYCVLLSVANHLFEPFYGIVVFYYFSHDIPIYRACLIFVHLTKLTNPVQQRDILIRNAGCGEDRNE